MSNIIDYIYVYSKYKKYHNISINKYYFKFRSLFVMGLFRIIFKALCLPTLHSYLFLLYNTFCVCVLNLAAVI